MTGINVTLSISKMFVGGGNVSGLSMSNLTTVTEDTPMGGAGNANEEIGVIKNFSEPVILSDQMLTYIDLGVGVPLCSLVSTFGIITNVVNILVFLQQGVQGTVTLAFFALAWSDMGLCVTSLETVISYSIHVYLENAPRVTASVHYLTGAYVRALFYAISGYLTLFVAIEQCLNVALPFQMKRFKSSSRIIFVIILIYMVCILLFTPYFIAQGIRRFTPPQAVPQLSLVAAWFLEHGRLFEILASTFSGIFTPTVNQILMILSSTKMTSVLRSSLEFRNKSKVTQTVSTIQDDKDEKRHYPMNTKDRTLLKMVNMVSVLFIACNFPVMVIVYCRRLIPGLSFTGCYRNLHTALHWIVIFCGSLNSGVNIFIYMKLSSKFRLAFRVLLRKASRQHTETTSC